MSLALSDSHVALAGKAILARAFGGSSTSASSSTNATAAAAVPSSAEPEDVVELVVTAEHPVLPKDEREHGLLAVPRGAIVRLVRGDLIKGLEAPYGDYVLVKYGRNSGKVSKFVLRQRGAMPGKSARSLVPHAAVLE